MHHKSCFLLSLLLSIGFQYSYAQTSTPPSGTDTTRLDLPACLRFAMKHQPGLRVSLVNQQIYDYQVKGALADWLPQVSGSGEVQHYYQIPEDFIPESVFTPGAPGYEAFPSTTKNVSTLGVGLTQNIYNRDVMLAAKTAKYYRKYAQESVDSAKIDLVVDVSKAYYDVFMSEEQLDILQEDITRLERSLRDTKNQYEAGTVDKTDYKQALILLNNARIQYKQALVAIPAKYAYLKQLMGFPVDSLMALHSDSAEMVSEAIMDTGMQLDYTRRIEIQSLETQKQLQIASYDYQRLGWLPSLSFEAAYNLGYGNNALNQLYNTTYPSSYIGLSLSIPIFQGFKRIYAMRAARLGEQLVDLHLEDTKRVINTQFAQAMAAYRGDLENWQVTQDNIQLSKEVYNTVTLQYKEGIKTYLDVITAEADLRTSELNGLNALFSLLSDKLDVLKAVGAVNTNIN
jgi:outer membrane protein TolC